MLLNRDRAIAYMEACGLDAIVATSPVNVRYFTDYSCWLAPVFREYMLSPGGSSELAHTNIALFPLKGEPAIAVEAIYAADALESWVSDLRAVGDGGFEVPSSSGSMPDRLERIASAVTAPPENETPIDALVRALGERGLTDGRIGIELEGLPHDMASRLADRLPKARLLDCTNLIRLIRAVKSPAEIAHLARAAEIAEHAAIESLAVAQSGRGTDEVVARFRASVAHAGADFDHFAFGPRGIGIMTEPRYTFAAGDVMFVDFGCTYCGYFSDTGTTLCVGEPSRTFVERHRAVRDCLLTGADAMRPGVRGSQVRGAMWDVLTAHRIRDSYPHGHGFGLEARDYPIIVSDNGLRIRDDTVDVGSDLPLEEGMVVNLEAAIFTLGEGSVHTEQSFVVTGRGVRSLIHQERDQPLTSATLADIAA